MKKVLIFGTFDIIHDGHRFVFAEAKKLGDVLHVVLARDTTIRSVKGKDPYYDEKQRMLHLEKEKDVDVVHLGEIDDKYKILGDVMPDVIALGYDQKTFVRGLEEQCDRFGLLPEIKRLPSYHPEVFKSSIIRKQKEEESTN